MADRRAGRGLGEEPIIPPELVEEAVRAEALADGAELAITAHADAVALRRILADIATAQPGAIEAVKTVAEGRISLGCLESYRTQLVLAGEALVDILDRYPERGTGWPDGSPTPRPQFYRVHTRVEGRREGFRHSLEVGGWVNGIRRRIDGEEEFIRECSDWPSMSPTASPRVYKDALIAGLREAKALAERFGRRPHPLDLVNLGPREQLSAAQMHEMETIRSSSKNWFDGDLVANDLLNRAHLWRVGAIVGHHDTVFLLPRHGQERLLDYLAHTWQADECRWTTPGVDDPIWAGLFSARRLLTCGSGPARYGRGRAPPDRGADPLLADCSRDCESARSDCARGYASIPDARTHAVRRVPRRRGGG